ncbi:MAG: OB-fold putative lipoprotein [Bacteroidetes bacterium]|nr:OB-fold putative lipoprotein [Bacteroidota bacterium]MBU1580785.1 OB-fold putative lipoprotein [Bacteroidota bacterium]MBU2465014.1 OB-fold putative lipoprotein [Bacteroidota bacterium]MBU2558666.1 OB-fold putative lipoprotein [Bacteroidota bacterium]
MKKWIKVLLVLAIIGLAGATYMYVFVYNKSHPDYANLKPDFETNAEALFVAFKNNPHDAASTYNGKIIRLSGKLNKVEKNEDQTIAYFILDEGMFGNEGVRISLLPEEANKLVPSDTGKSISIKGFCTGYNDSDVILEHGSLDY